MAALGFTQSQLDKAIEALADPNSSGSVSVEGRSWSWTRGNKAELIQLVRMIQEDLATQSGNGRKRFTLAQYNRNL